MLRDTYAYVDLNRLTDNLNKIYAVFQKPMYAVLKANAYGHGVVKVLETIDPLPFIKGYCVATLQEGVEIRKAGYTKQILVIGTVKEETLEVASLYDITVTVFDEEFAKDIEKINYELKVQIKLDTGMHRIGLRSKEQLSQVYSLLKNNPHIIMDGVFTHFATADCDLKEQKIACDRFKEMIQGFEFTNIHGANSATMMHIPDHFTNCGRIGIGMYGIDPYFEDLLDVKPIMSLYTTVMMVKQIRKGDYVGYGYTYQAKEDEYIATLPIGYADGFIRKNQGRQVYINGNKYTIVGRVCMDQMMVKVDENVHVGDEVEIFGDHISIYDMANDLETIPYEILTLLSLRVERKYSK